MKISLYVFVSIFLFSVSIVYSQQPTTTVSAEQIQNISTDLSKISKSVDELSKQMKKFSETFSSNQGLRLSERQQQLLFAFEILNRAEQRLATLQTLKLTFAEKQTLLRLQLAQITDDLLPQSIDRYVSLRGTTNVEQLKQIRRQALEKEKIELTNTIFELQNNINESNNEINQLQTFLRNIRQRIFGEIDKELSGL